SPTPRHTLFPYTTLFRSELRQGDSESQLRRWLTRKLNERARQRFTVPQEAVIDREERPDLRIENPKTAAVSVEVKWADERSANRSEEHTSELQSRGHLVC